MRNRISFRAVLRELTYVGVGLIIALGIGVTVIAFTFAVVQVVS